MNGVIAPPPLHSPLVHPGILPAHPRLFILGVEFPPHRHKTTRSATTQHMAYPKYPCYRPTPKHPIYRHPTKLQSGRIMASYPPAYPHQRRLSV